MATRERLLNGEHIIKLDIPVVLEAKKIYSFNLREAVIPYDCLITHIGGSYTGVLVVKESGKVIHQEYLRDH